MHPDQKEQTDFPYRAIVRKLDEKEFRIRSLPRSLSIVAPWVIAKQGQPTICAAMIGPDGGLILSPLEAEVVKIESTIHKAFQEQPPTFHDAGSQRLKLGRFAAGIWHVKFSFESSQKFTLTLLTEMREIGVFPETEKYLVVFPTGGIIEVWPASEWKMHQRVLVKGISQITDNAREEIGGL